MKRDAALLLALLSLLAGMVLGAALVYSGVTTACEDWQGFSYNQKKFFCIPGDQHVPEPGLVAGPSH